MSLEEDLRVLETLPISSWKYPRVAVAIPIERAISHAQQVFYNFLYIATQSPWLIECPYGRIDIVRNNIAAQLLSSECTHVLMLDVDHKHPTNIVQQFAKWALIRPDAQVISGLNFRRGEPYDAVMGNLSKSGRRDILTQWAPGLTQYAEVGGASLFIHRNVFETIPPPWFVNDYTGAWENNYPGEDVGFCKRCAEYNIPIYVDSGITSPHCSDTLVTERTFRAFMASHQDRFKDVVDEVDESVQLPAE